MEALRNGTVEIRRPEGASACAREWLNVNREAAWMFEGEEAYGPLQAQYVNVNKMYKSNQIQIK